LKKIISILLFLFSITIYAGGGGDKKGGGGNFYSADDKNNTLISFWKLMYLGGELNFKSYYRDLEWVMPTYSEYNKNNGYSGGITLNSKSYVWHPDVLQLDVGVTYNPGKNSQNYLILEDRSEVSSRKKLNLGATFLSNKPVTINTYFRINESFQNRENLTNIKINNTTKGGSLKFREDFFPLWVNYEESNWKQNELAINRKYTSDKKSFNAKIVKSFFVLDRHHLTYNHDENIHEYVNNFQGFSENTIKNTINNANLQSKVFFSKERASNFSSLINYHTQIGNTDFKRFRAYGTTQFYLPRNLLSISIYEYSDIELPSQRSAQHRLSTDIGHQLGNSIKTNLFFKYTDLNHTFYNEKTYRSGISFAYNKKLPTNGLFGLTYKYTRFHDDMTSESLLLNILNEEHTLSDVEIELLDKPYLDINSVIVKDITGAIIYQLNFDYFLIQIGNFVEIRRVPGGQIADGDLVYVDYQATQPGTYNFDANLHSFSTSILLFKNILELYYRRNQQGYANTDQVEFLTLNYFTENIVGTKVKLDFGEAGIEYNTHESTIVPYKMTRYYIGLYHNLKSKLLLSINGSVRDYKGINNEIEQTYIDVSSRITYSFKPQTKLNFDVGYRNQIGDNINLELLTARCEFITILRQLYFTLGIEAYRRSYINQDINLNGAYIRITRKF
jgi:hypothetical protein